MSLRDGEKLMPQPKDKSTTTVEWGKNGDGSAVFTGASEIPSDEDIRNLLERVGKNPDDYVWEIIAVSWNSAAWHRDPDGIGGRYTAYTKPACVVKIRIDRKTDSSDLTLEVRQAEPVTVSIRATNRLPQRRTTDLKCAVIYADSQIWYYRDRGGIWHPTHDEAALDIGLQITADVEAEHGIDAMVDLGDLGDFPVVSNHPSPLAMTLHESTNMSVSRISRLMAERTALSPSAEIRRWLQGNHEQRWTDWLANNAPHLVGLQRAGEIDIPVLSLKWLTRADEHGWTLGGRSYPNDVFWLNANTRCVHGTIAKTQVGATLNEYLKEEVNTFAGHTPHAGLAYRTIARNGGTRTYVVCTPGGFMRRDGMVPSGNNKNTDWGQPSESDGVGWEQGMAVVFYSADGTTVPQIEHIPIFGGKAVWRGKVYNARCDVDGNILES